MTWVIHVYNTINELNELLETKNFLEVKGSGIANMVSGVLKFWAVTWD